MKGCWMFSEKNQFEMFGRIRHRTKYSRIGQVKFVEDSLWKIYLNTLVHTSLNEKSWLATRGFEVEVSCMKVQLWNPLGNCNPDISSNWTRQHFKPSCSCWNLCSSIRDRRQILLLILSKFKQISWLLIPLKSSESHFWWFQKEEKWIDWLKFA